MMIDINKLLKYVQRTNPTMTREKLIEELSKSRYSSIALVMIAENIKQENKISYPPLGIPVLYTKIKIKFS